MKPVKDVPYFELVVWLPGRGALRQVFQAEDLQQAVELAEGQYGGCLVQVPAPVACKPVLIRSKTSPSLVQRARYKRARKFTNTFEK
jgi:hypothetical protein